MAAARFFLRRLVSTAPVLVIVALLTFAMLNVTPGDAGAVAAGADASPEAIEAARERLGLNNPLP